MRFNKAVNEGLVNPVAMKLVRQAMKDLGKNANKKKIKEYIKSNLVKNKEHAERNDGFIDGAIDSIKSGQI